MPTTTVGCHNSIKFAEDQELVRKSTGKKLSDIKANDIQKMREDKKKKKAAAKKWKAYRDSRGSTGSASVSLSSSASSSVQMSAPVMEVKVEHAIESDEDQSINTGSLNAESNDDAPSSSTTALTVEDEGKQKVAEALYAAMDNEKLCDVTLVGRHHEVKVRAAKFVLASRSKALQECLYEDPSAQEVFMGHFSEMALRALVEFCHTGTVNRSSPEIALDTRGVVQGWAELSELAKKFEFTELHIDAHSALTSIIEQDPKYACCLYDFAAQHGNLEDTKEYALGILQASPSQVLMASDYPGVQYLSPGALEELLMNELYVNDMTRILILTRWIDCVGRTPGNVSVACHCASNIPLDHMDPNFLLTECKESGLFDINELHVAAGLDPPESPSAGPDFLSSKPTVSPDTPPNDWMYQKESYVYSAAHLTERSPEGKSKKEKRKKSKKNRPAEITGQCYQITKAGVVLLVNTETPDHLPDFEGRSDLEGGSDLDVGSDLEGR